METQFMPLLEEIKSLVKANLEGQRAFGERFDRRLTEIENKMAEDTKLLFAAVKESSTIKAELVEVKNWLDSLEVKLEQLDARIGRLETKVEQLGEKAALSTRKNEIWFDLVAREYGKLRFDLDVLKEEVSLSGINAG